MSSRASWWPRRPDPSPLQSLEAAATASAAGSGPSVAAVEMRHPA